jgi:hypothetical protein
MFPITLAGVLFVSAVGIYPASPTSLVFRSRDFGGKPRETVVVKSLGSRVRLEAFHQTLLFDGTRWHLEGELPEEAAGAVAFMALLSPQGNVRVDGLGRPTLMVDVPAGRRKARIEYRYDAVGLSAVNLVLSDGSGYQFRRAEASAATFTQADFEPPRRVEPGLPVLSAEGQPPDFAAVDRLMSIVIAPSEQMEFEKAAGIGPFQTVPR